MKLSETVERDLRDLDCLKVNRRKTLGLKFNFESASLGSTLGERDIDG